MSCDRTEVAILNIGVDIEDAARVVVADDGRLGGAGDAGDVGQDFRGFRCWGCEWNVFEVAQRLDLVLRCLRDDAVENVVLVVEEKLGRELCGAGQDIDSRSADVALGITAIERLGAVDGDFEDGRVVRLFQAEVDEAWNLAESLHHLRGDRAVADVVCTFDLDVDGRGEAKVEDLSDDVGGKEIESDAGEFAGEAFAQRANVVGCGRVVFLERDENIRVGGAEEPAGCVLGVHGRVGKADVIEDVVHLVLRDGGTNGLLDEITQTCGFLDTGSGFGADVEDEGAVIAVGKEILSEQRDEQQRNEADEQEEGYEDFARFDELGEERLVGGPDGFKAALKSALDAGKDILRERGVMVDGLEEVHGHRRYEGSRQDVGGDHREDDGFGERHEEIARDAGEEEHRQEDDADGERGNQRRDGDLGGAFEDGFAQLVALFEIAFDVLDGDGGVVDQDADGECEATEGHDVDGLADEAENDDGGEDRERDGDGDDEGGAPGAEEEKDHQAGEGGGDDAFANDSVDGGADEDGLVADGRDLELFGDGGGDARQQVFDALDDAEGRGGAGLEDGEENAAMAVLANDVGLRDEPSLTVATSLR